jgi:RNA polymerase sigma-70 factor (ECF subfamily)
LRLAGHSLRVRPTLDVASLFTPEPVVCRASSRVEGALVFEDVYERCFDFVWRNVRRLGVSDAGVDDVVQEVFLVVHRRLAEFEQRSSLKTWLFGIMIRVARDHRRTLRRKSPHTRSAAASVDADTVADEHTASPHEAINRTQEVLLLYKLLDELDDDKRAVFVLAELEQMSAPVIAELLAANVNTIYARLRAARRDFEQAVTREKARNAWRFG